PPAPSQPHLYLDLEGINLSRHGTISLLTLYVPPLRHAYLIDVHTLGALAFSTPCSLTGTTLGTLLASPTPTKVLFDLRNDSDALFARYGVRLRGVEDVQLMENAGRPTAAQRRTVNGLERCIEKDLGGPGRLTAAEQRAWREVKEAGKRLFAPERGGRYEVFEERPVRAEVERYCVNDVVLLPMLRELYLGRLSAQWKARVAEETEKRVRESQSAGYKPHGREKALGPW
ncbi:ribonuclease H-like domain-containing protein, partial [Schizothecium vesticola]